MRWADFAPAEIMKGAVLAAEMPSVSRLVLVGEETAVRRELDGCSKVSPKVEVLHAAEVVGMEESPAQAIRRKRDSSIGRAVDLVRDGEADAVVSAGNTGAVVVAATLKLRMIEGVVRPSIATVMPTPKRPFVLIDAGANTDCGAGLLVQFAVMGSVYSRIILGEANPVVGLMSIGGEDTKGNDITKEAFRLLQASHLNFRGNVEGHDLYRGETDVVVCDGFVGNIVLKTSESAAHAIGHWLRQELRANMIRRVGSALLWGAMKAMKKRLDPENYGGAPLLGVRGVCIITHGASTARAIYHAVRIACESVHHRLNESIVYEIARLNAAP